MTAQFDVELECVHTEGKFLYLKCDVTCGVGWGRKKMSKGEEQEKGRWRRSNFFVNNKFKVDN